MRLGKDDVDVFTPARSASGGRFVVTTLSAAVPGPLRAWTAFRAQLLRTPAENTRAPRSRSSSVSVWRILATNNREVGRGASLHATAEEAIRAAHGVRARLDQLQTVVVRGASPMTHGWVFALDGVPVVLAARWYESAVEASSGARNARKTLAGVAGPSDVVAGPDTTRPGQATPIG